MVTACVWRSIINFCVMLSYGDIHYFGSELHPSWGWNRVHVRFPKWPSLHDLVISTVQREKGQQGIWSFNSVCGIHNAEGEGGEMVWPVQCWGCWPWCFLILNRKLWKLLCFWTVSEIIGIWVSSSTENPSSNEMPVLLLKRALLNHPSIPQAKLHWSPQNNVNLLDPIIFLECRHELYTIALKPHSKI